MTFSLYWGSNMENIIYSKEAREKLRAGVDKLANAVSTTLGARGRNVAIQRQFGAPNVVNDGVTVARSVKLEDKFENMGATLVLEAAAKTNDKAGDGTTTATLLAQELVNMGLNTVEEGENPMVIKKDMVKAVDKVIKKIEEMAVPIKSTEDKNKVATVSAQDEEIGAIIAEALDKVGDDGVVTVEEFRGFGIELDYKEGMQLEMGYASPYFLTNPQKMEAELDDVSVLVVDYKIESIKPLIPVLNQIKDGAKRLFVVADDISTEALSAFVINKMQGVFASLVIKAPGFGENRKDILKDIAAVTGATLISKELGMTLDAVTMKDLGGADRIISNSEDTVIIGGRGDKANVKERIDGIKLALKEAPTNIVEERLQKRLAKLTSGIAVIRVGAPTETELHEKKLRVDDAVNATQAAVEEGIVAGGGVALYRARDVLSPPSNKAENILFEALGSPIKKILANAGQDVEKVLAKLDLEEQNVGLDIVTNKVGDMIEMGIVDPAKVTKEALKNAVSVAMMVITTECLIGLEEPKNAQ